MSKSPCVNCKDRNIIETEDGIKRCHSWCEKYKEWSKQNEMRKKRLNQYNEANSVESTRGTRYYKANKREGIKGFRYDY